MPTKRTTLFAAAVSVLLISAAPAGEIGAEVLANSDIVALSRAGMAPQVIVAKIASSSNIFDVSSRGLLSLKENGVADDVIAGMLAAGGPAAGAPAAAPDPARLRQELANLASPGPDIRSAAMAWFLANRPAALPELRRALTERDPAVRAAAVAALGDLRDGESLHAIRNLIVSPDPAVRRAAAQALFALGDNQSVNAAEQALSRGVTPLDGYIRLVGHAKLTRAAAALGQILSANPDGLSRSAAAWSLGEIGRAATAGRPALERAIEADADADVRRESAGAIAKFHDSGSAALLMDACRRDPEVRTVALSGLAEYPESVEFLVGVMNLGADQIAVNELETARASLYRLTGQDFGLDGARWGSWFAGNRGAFAAGRAASMGVAGGLAAGGALPLYSAGLGAGLGGAAAPAASVDVEAWSLIADANDIPMAPQVDAGSLSAAPGGIPGLTSFAARPPTAAGAGRPAAPPGAADSSSIPMVPLALSPNDFDAGAGFTLPGLTPPSTQSIPAMDIAQGTLTGAPTLPIPPMEAQQSLLGIGSAASSSAPATPIIAAPAAATAEAAPAGGSLQSGGLFRTWSSDPDRGAPEPRTEDEAPSRTFAGFPGRTDGAAAPEAATAAEAIAGAGAGTETPPAAAAAAPDAPGQWRRVPAEELSGGLAADTGADPFATPLPSATTAQPADSFAAAPFAAPADIFASPPTDAFTPGEATASAASPFGDSPPALLPTGPIVTPLSADAAEEADADPLRGFSLSLPGMTAGAADSSAGTVTDAAQSFADGVADAVDAAGSPFTDAGMFPDDGGMVIDDSGNVFPLPDAAGGVSFMPEDASVPPYDPAAQPGETVLFGDELGGIVDFGGADFSGGLDAAGLGTADPFAAPDGLPAVAPGETVIFAPAPAGGDVFGGLPALDGTAAQGADGFVQNLDEATQGITQSVDGIIQGADGFVQDAGAFVQDAAQSVDSSAQSVTQSVDNAIQSAGNAMPTADSSLFVDPEPGQVMVDEDWTGAGFDGADTGTVFSAPQIDFPEPKVISAESAIDFPEPQVAAEPVPGEVSEPAPGTAAAYTNPYEHNPPPPNPAFITTDPNFVPPIREYTGPYRAPAAQAATPADGGGIATTPPAPAATGGRAASNAKAAGDGMPPMLGEGFFGK